MIGVAVEEQHLVLIRDEGRFFAAERACPHEGADLMQGRCSGSTLHCPRHLAWFDLNNGAVSPGWSFRALKVYPACLIGSDIWIDLARVGANDQS